MVEFPAQSVFELWAASPVEAVIAEPFCPAAQAQSIRYRIMSNTPVWPWDLSNPDLYDHGIPHEAFAALRDFPGLPWNPLPGEASDGFWAVGRHDEVALVSRETGLFSSAKGHIQLYTIDEDALEARASMIDMDPPAHTRLRRLVNPSFVPRAAQGFAEVARARARACLDALQSKGSGDWAAEVAKPIPISIICDILGVPQCDHELMVELTDQLVGATGGGTVDAGAYGNTTPLRLLPFNHPASHAIFEYARRLGEERRRAPREDLVTQLVQARIDGEALTESEFANFFRLLIFAGNETTRTAMSHLALQLVAFPAQFERVRANRELVASAVEEIVRYATPLYHFRRTATRDAELAGTPIREGDKVVVWYAAANFDERVFPRPLDFDVARPRSPGHAAYGGGGPHICLGAHLARVEIAQLLEEILDRRLRLEIASPPRYVHSNFANGIAGLEVRVRS